MAQDRKAPQLVIKRAHNIMALLAVHSQTTAICFTSINAQSWSEPRPRYWWLQPTRHNPRPPLKQVLSALKFFCRSKWISGFSSSSLSVVSVVYGKNANWNHLQSISVDMPFHWYHWDQRILKPTTHPSYSLFTLLPPGWRCRGICCSTTRLQNSFFPGCETPELLVNTPP